MDSGDGQKFRKTWEDFYLSEDLTTSGLRLKQLKGTQDRWSIRVSLSERIILWHPEGELWVAERCGPKEQMYAHANNIKTIPNLLKGKLVHVLVGENVQRPEGSDVANVGDVVHHWSDEELSQIAGFTKLQVADLRQCQREEQLYSFHSEFGYEYSDAKWTDDLVEEALSVLSKNPDDYFKFAIDTNPLLALAKNGGFEDMSPALSAVDMQALGWTNRPIEDWMIFLHPSQREAVVCHSNGPLFVGGAAGTGKSVVGYHRAVELAKRYESSPIRKPVLVTTFNKPFSNTQRNLLQSLSGKAISRIEVATLDSVAIKIAGWVDGDALRRAFRTALRGSSLRSRFSGQYLEDEIRLVIKGRGITEFEEYLSLERRGRRTAFNRRTREEVWDLYLSYQQELGKSSDYQDRILEATMKVNSQPPRYRACVVDEIQDFTLAKLKLVRALVVGSNSSIPADGLTLLGDRAQRLYPGGASLREAEIETRGQGRSFNLNRNYRNSAEILSAALAIEKPEGESLTAAETYLISSAPVMNYRPSLYEMKSKELQDQAIVALIKKSTSSNVQRGDLAVIVKNGADVKRYSKVLKDAGIWYQSLGNYDGKTNNAVKIGTFRHCRSLEFKVVILPDVSESELPPARDVNTGDEERAEELEALKRHLYVAMTRARERLYLLFIGEPSEFLWTHLDKFNSPKRFRD